MGTKRDYYEILGIEKNADAGKIKSAYRKLAKKYHPDTNSGDAVAEQKFKEVTEAYNVLSDPEKKKLYDQFGHAGPDGSPANSGFYQDPDGSYWEYHYQSGDMDDLFGDIFGDLFRGRQSGSFRQGGFRQEAFRQKGGNLHADISVTFEEAAFGCDKVITLSSPENGQPPQTLKVRIPAGIDSGKSIQLRGKGMPGSNGGEPGDLLLKVSVLKKPGFERKGLDLYTTADIPFTVAALGGEAYVQTLAGNVLCKIQPGTQSGTKIRLRGKGIVYMKDASVHGDQYVTIRIQVPRNLSPEAKKRLREFDAAYNGTSSDNSRHATSSN